MRSQSCHCVIDAFSRISHLGTLPRTIFNEVSKFGASDDASTWKKELVDLLAKSKQAAADDMKGGDEATAEGHPSQGIDQIFEDGISWIGVVRRLSGATFPEGKGQARSG